MNDGLRVPELFHHVLDHAEDYRAIVVSPYLFWTTFAVGQIAPERTILRPCLHDEPYARMELFEPLFTGAAGPVAPDRARARAADRPASRPPARSPWPARASRCPSGYDPEGFRSRHGLGDRTVRALRRPARGRQGLAGPARRVRRGGPQGGPRPPPRHLRRGRGRPARRCRRPGRRPRLPLRRGPRRRHGRGRRVRPAVDPRELLPHDHGGVAGRHAGHRQPGRRRRPLALRAVRRRPALRRRRRARAVPALRGRGPRRGRGRWPSRAATTCSTTTPGRSRSTAWRPPSTSGSARAASMRGQPTRAGARRRAVPAVAGRDRRLRRAAGAPAPGRRPRRRGLLPQPLGRPPPPRPEGPGRRRRPRPPDAAASTGRSSTSTPTSSTRRRPPRAPAPPRASRWARRSGPAPHVDVRLHELDHRWGDPRDPSSVATRWMLQGRRRRCRCTRPSSATSCSTGSVCRADEGRARRPRRRLRGPHLRRPGDRPRRRSACPQDEHVFLCIGFVQAHKGFDRAVRAFSGLAAQGARLDVVGSVRLDDQQTADHVDELRRLAARDRRRPPPLRVRERRAPSTAGSSPPTPSCSPTATSGPRASPSGPRSSAAP